MSSQVKLILLVWGAHFVEGPVLQRRIIWKAPQLGCIWEACQILQDLHQKKIPWRDEDFFFSCKEQWLNFTVGFGSSPCRSCPVGGSMETTTRDWNEDTWRFYWVSAPPVLLFTCPWGPAAARVKTYWLFCVCVRFAREDGFFSELSLQFWSCVCWPQVSSHVYPQCALLTTDGPEGWGDAVRMLSDSEMEGCWNARLSWMELAQMTSLGNSSLSTTSNSLPCFASLCFPCGKA